MKTAISLPGDTFERVSRRANDLGMSRSEFFARAANRYLDELDAASVAKQINAALERLGGTDESNEAAAQAGRQLLLDVSDEW
ncbi:MAG TPA: ribbon-helix-helix protein, CopG family [Microbacteriaceae bacterium]